MEHTHRKRRHPAAKRSLPSTKAHTQAQTQPAGPRHYDTAHALNPPNSTRRQNQRSHTLRCEPLTTARKEQEYTHSLTGKTGGGATAVGWTTPPPTPTLWRRHSRPLVHTRSSTRTRAPSSSSAHIHKPRPPRSAGHNFLRQQQPPPASTRARLMERQHRQHAVHPCPHPSPHDGNVQTCSSSSFPPPPALSSTEFHPPRGV